MKMNTLLRLGYLLATMLSASLVGGCASDADLILPPDDVTKTSFGRLIGEQSAPSGFAIDPQSGQRYILDPQLGIMELLPNGDIVSLWSPSADLPTLTDLCSVGGGRFIAAADGDGYIIDVAAGAARQHFCLEPGWDPGFDPEGETKHLNRSVACDIEAGLIYGQPQTVLKENEGQMLRSEVASYLLATGADQQWVALPTPSYHAGGMAMVRSGLLLLGAGQRLSTFDAHNGRLKQIADLGRFGVGEVAALSVDRFSNTVIIVDQRDNTMVEIPMHHLGL